MNVLISACLLGINCRYDGREKRYGEIDKIPENINLIPICPEQLGGLPTPRPPAERKGERVYNIEGKDVTENFIRGAEETLKTAEIFGCRYAILKEKSPSCGKGLVYDGSFGGVLVPGEGITAERLLKAGIKVIGESRITEFFKEMEKNE